MRVFFFKLLNNIVLIVINPKFKFNLNGHHGNCLMPKIPTFPVLATTPIGRISNFVLYK